ncbi:MAG: hypothetical protein OXC54_03725 [Rhodospirillaceae bacterium]|nr:hypothetical protein [Rhodospirillaceae bacterium]
MELFCINKLTEIAKSSGTINIHVALRDWLECIGGCHSLNVLSAML